LIRFQSDADRMKRHRKRKSAKSEVEALELRQHMSATSFAGGVLSLEGVANQNNSFTVRAIDNNAVVYGIANNQGQVVEASQVKKIVVYTGDDTDTVSINRNSPFSVEVISTTGAISWVAPGQTETFGPAATHVATPASTPAPSNTGSSGNSANSGSSSSSSGSSGSSDSNDPISTSTSSSSSNADTPKPVITITSATTVLTNQTVNVQALASTFGDSDSLHSTITWNFGDPGSQYNQLVGFNAAHAYANPGVYTITLTITTPDGHTADVTTTVTVKPFTGTTIYVSTSGSDSNSGLSPNDPIQSIARANELMGNNTQILFERGDTFTTANPNSPLLDNGYQNVFIGAYGTGANPIIFYNGPKDNGTIISSTNSAVGLTVEGLTFDSIYTNNGATGMIPSAIIPGGSDIAVLNNTFYNVQGDVGLSTAPTNVLIQGNTSPEASALQGYFVWVQGNDIAIVGNTVAGSAGQSIVRVEGANNLLIAENNITSQFKGSLVLQQGNYAYVYDNVVNGVIAVGPLDNTLPSSMAQPDAQFTNCVLDSNQVWGPVQIEPNAINTLAENNVIYSVSGSDGFEIFATTSLFPNRQAQYVYLLNNTVYDNGQQTYFLNLQDGQALGVVMDNNLFYDPNFNGATSAVFVAEGSINSFSQIQNNVWPDAPKMNFFIGSAPGGTAGYLTPAQWEATGVPTGDVYQNTAPAAGTNDVEADGITDGSDLPADATPTQTMQAEAADI
jgi:hypothetical protein